ncbi:MAG: glycosyltransferase family 2 protein [Chloroflexi bacterium]|nr:glycosyltransferase family 2 protein [Chloroflexota bacterium]
MTTLSIVIPALDEAGGIADIAGRVLGARAGLAAIGVEGLELIVVDDGSTDGTAEIAEAIAGVTVLRHPRNAGYGAAIKTGFRSARGELLAFLDADGTYPPEAFPELCQALLSSGADLVVGTRMGHPESGMPLTRRLGNRLFVQLINLLGRQRISDSASGQRVLRREALAKLYPLPDGLNFTPVMTTRALHEQLTMMEVPIRYEERVGDSKLSPLQDGRRFLSTIIWTALAYNPARVLGLVGLALLGLGGLLGLGLVATRAAGVTRLGPWGVAGAVGTLVSGVAGVSILNLGITFNYLVGLFHREPVEQGLFGRPVLPGLDRHFGLLGLTALALGLATTATALLLGFGGWDLPRIWLWLLGGALFTLVGLQLGISWLLMRVLEELSLREAKTALDLGDPAATSPVEMAG